MLKPEHPKALEVEIEGYPPGSLIWVKCGELDDVKDVTKAVQELGLDNYNFIITGPKAELAHLSREELVDALKLIHQMKTQDGALPN